MPTTSPATLRLTTRFMASKTCTSTQAMVDNTQSRSRLTLSLHILTATTTMDGTARLTTKSTASLLTLTHNTSMSLVHTTWTSWQVPRKATTTVLATTSVREQIKKLVRHTNQVCANRPLGLHTTHSFLISAVSTTPCSTATCLQQQCVPTVLLASPMATSGVISHQWLWHGRSTMRHS